jgi:FkbM family methyltransferase
LNYMDNTEQQPIGDMNLFLRSLAARGFTPLHILDVGANYGNWSWVAKEAFPNAAFTLVEPQIEMKSYLDGFCEKTGRSRWVNAGAGPRNEERVLTVWPDLAGSSFTPTESEAKEYSKERRIVPVRTIDSILAESDLPLPELVKMDIQGFELEALQGANTLLGKTELFILEVSFFRFSINQPTFVAVIEFMFGQGYVPYDFCGFLRRPYDGALGQADIAFAKEKGLLRSSNRWE